MRGKFAAVFAALGVLGVAGTAAAAPAAIVPPTCDPACLQGFIDR